MEIDQELYTNWVNSLVKLTQIGQNNGFLGDEGVFDVCLASDTEKISIFLKIEPTNIIAFPKK